MGSIQFDFDTGVLPEGPNTGACDDEWTTAKYGTPVN